MYVFIYLFVIFILYEDQKSHMAMMPLQLCFRGHICHEHHLCRDLVQVLGGVVHDGHHSQPGLLGSGDNLYGWQDEAVTAGISQLEGVGVLDARVVGPVHGAAAGLVYKMEHTLIRNRGV